jgi:hypothetical protein
VAEFGIDVIRLGDGLGYFFTEELTVTLAEAVQGDAHGRFGEAKRGGENGVRSVGRTPG